MNGGELETVEVVPQLRGQPQETVATLRASSDGELSSAKVGLPVAGLLGQI